MWRQQTSDDGERQYGKGEWSRMQSQAKRLEINPPNLWHPISAIIQDPNDVRTCLEGILGCCIETKKKAKNCQRNYQNCQGH
ncbi:hypothetical protein EON65_42025 [archaeon]|nr:MAG: hypothetical protein EON65_42025 [archaeon]